MLRRLSVENYALIDKLEMELDPHLNIITGETGAGKSILLGALGLLLGAKNDGSAMKDAARNCTVKGRSTSRGAVWSPSSRRTTSITPRRPPSRASSPRPARAAPSSTTSRCS